VSMLRSCETIDSTLAAFVNICQIPDGTGYFSNTILYMATV